MIVVTGALGFIGSALLGELQRMGFGELVAVDDFMAVDKLQNLAGKSIVLKIDRMQYFSWMDENASKIQFIFHIGARTKTNEFDEQVLQTLNVEYSQKMWHACVKHNIPLIYASSAATYGDGAMGFSDEPSEIVKLKPLNPYGNSKQQFDLWALEQVSLGLQPPFWAGFKFFNVFGPNEYHKGRMASVVYHAFNEIQSSGKVSLFRSHRSDYGDGQQERDFIYVKDVLSVLMHFFHNRKNGGLYNLGTGLCRTFLDLAKAVFAAMGRTENISFIDMPADIRDRYQYHTEADTSRLLAAGYNLPFSPLELAVEDYVNHYLVGGAYL